MPTPCNPVYTDTYRSPGSVHTSPAAASEHSSSVYFASQQHPGKTDKTILQQLLCYLNKRPNLCEFHHYFHKRYSTIFVFYFFVYKNLTSEIYSVYQMMPFGHFTRL